VNWRWVRHVVWDWLEKRRLDGSIRFLIGGASVMIGVGSGLMSFATASFGAMSVVASVFTHCGESLDELFLLKKGNEQKFPI
jgi:hypothetical protein